MKNNNQELKVILSKVAWCGHCTNFLPVFNKSQKLTKNNKYLKNTNVNFEVYDMEEDLEKFKSNNYEDLLPQINGYPTVIVTSLKNGKRVNTEIIDHSSDPLQFINTVGETYNKLVSQSGGNKEEFYKQKYLKYKSKYTELKDYKFNINSKQKGGLKNIEAYHTEPPTAEELFFINEDNLGLVTDIIVAHEKDKKYIEKFEENFKKLVELNKRAWNSSKFITPLTNILNMNKIEIERQEKESQERERQERERQEKERQERQEREKQERQEREKQKKEKEAKLKDFIINYKPVILEKGDANIRYTFIELRDWNGRDINVPVDYVDMISRIYSKTEDELKVLLDNLYFYDEYLFQFKKIFMATNKEDSEKEYELFKNEIKDKVSHLNKGWVKNLKK
jgi:thiol-disulfide isomerase/thioredoxin